MHRRQHTRSLGACEPRGFCFITLATSKEWLGRWASVHDTHTHTRARYYGALCIEESQTSHIRPWIAFGRSIFFCIRSSCYFFSLVRSLLPRPDTHFLFLSLSLSLFPSLHFDCTFLLIYLMFVSLFFLFSFADIASVVSSWFYGRKNNGIARRIIFGIERKARCHRVGIATSLGTQWPIQRRKRSYIVQVCTNRPFISYAYLLLEVFLSNFFLHTKIYVFHCIRWLVYLHCILEHLDVNLVCDCSSKQKQKQIKSWRPIKSLRATQKNFQLIIFYYHLRIVCIIKSRQKRKNQIRIKKKN